MTTEFELIEKLKAGWKCGNDVKIGPGDDASALHLEACENKLFLQTVDLLVEGVHFRKNWGSAYQLGWKSLAVNLSDIAAMGGQPLHTHLSLAVPGTWSEVEISEFMEGFKALADQYKISLLGGDLSRSDGPLMIAGTANGTVAANQVITRRGAKSGDVIWVSGPLGSAEAGLRLLKEEKFADDHKELLNAFLKPSPEVELGMLCASSGLVTALIDLSDGLAGDLGHVLKASGVGATLEEEKFPITQTLQNVAARNNWNITDLLLRGGEDYKLLGCTPETKFDQFRNLVNEQLGKTISRIGSITSEQGLVLNYRDGRCEKVNPTSFDHFA